MTFSTKTRRLVPIFLVIIAALGVLAWFLRAAQHEEKTAQEQKEEFLMFEITDQIIAQLASEHLGEKLPAEDVSAHISQDGTLTLRGTISSRALIRLLQENKIEMSSGMHLMIRLLPEKVRTLFELSIAVDPEEKKLLITPTRFEINDLDIAPMLLPPILKDGISDAANAYLKENNLHLGTITIEDGRIVICQ